MKIATSELPKDDPASWVTKNIGFDAVVEKFKPGKVKAFIMSPSKFKKGANAILVEGSDKVSIKLLMITTT